MAYIGVDPNIGDITFQTFTGTGSATAFTLAQSVVSGEALLVTIGNVVQEPGASKAYTAQGNTLTFSAAPANGDVITVRFFGRAVDQPTSYAMQLFKYVATNNQTAFTGADANGAILAFSGDDVDVYLNGVHLDSSDFTASNGDTITLGTGAAASDELVIRAYRAFTVTDTVSKASGGTFVGAVTVPQLNADNLRLDGNTISSTDTNGDITLDPNGSGDVVVAQVASSSLDIEGDRTDAQITLKGGSAGAGIQLFGSTYTNYAGAIYLDATASTTGTNDAQMVFRTGSTPSEAMRIDRSGNVGIGRSPVAKLDAYLGSGVGGLAVGVSGASTTILDSDLIQLRSGSGAERLRVDSSGRVLVGDSSSLGNGMFQVDATANFVYCQVMRANASNGAFVLFQKDDGSTIGQIDHTASATRYLTSSDYRLKENVADMTGAIDRVKALAPKRFNFIADPDDTTVDGFLAHETQTIVPEAVSGTHNEVDENGDAVMQGIDQSKLVPLLTGALQEAISKIETLETQRADLEARLTALES